MKRLESMTRYRNEIKQELTHDRHIAIALLKCWPFLAFMFQIHASVHEQYQTTIFQDSLFSINLYNIGACISLGTGIGLIVADGTNTLNLRPSNITIASLKQILPIISLALSLIIMSYLKLAY